MYSKTKACSYVPELTALACVIHELEQLYNKGFEFIHETLN